MVSRSQRAVPEMLPLPELRAPQRARLLLRWQEREDWEFCAETGWALLSDHWVLWLADEGEEWQSWPRERVVTIEWIGEQR